MTYESKFAKGTQRPTNVENIDDIDIDTPLQRLLKRRYKSAVTSDIVFKNGRGIRVRPATASEIEHILHPPENEEDIDFLEAIKDPRYSNIIDAKPDKNTRTSQNKKRIPTGLVFPRR